MTWSTRSGQQVTHFDRLIRRINFAKHFPNECNWLTFIPYRSFVKNNSRLEGTRTRDHTHNSAVVLYPASRQAADIIENNDSSGINGLIFCYVKIFCTVSTICTGNVPSGVDLTCNMNISFEVTGWACLALGVNAT